MSDLSAVVWKELREIVRQRNLRSSAVIMALLLGVLLPAVRRGNWIGNPSSVALWALVPASMIIASIADSFAGERERHTLEALLATRLSDRSILFGKLIAAVVSAFGIVLVVIALGAITANVAPHTGGLVFYPLDVLGGGLALAFLAAVLAASGGVLVSLRAETVRAAQQTLGIAFVIIGVGSSLALVYIPAEWKVAVLKFVATSGELEVALIAGVLFGAVDALLVLACVARFRREKLLL
ncbi:MAG: ABC transporter permease subunit [Thermoplasmatota archaeon]